MIKIFTDGASRGNGGESAAAYIIFDDDTELYRSVRHIGLSTNNMAEYRAVHDGIQYCYLNPNLVPDTEGYLIISDSMLVINQLKRTWKINNHNLIEINKNISFFIDHMTPPFNFEWRGRNDPILKQCDKMNNECLDALRL